MNKLLARAESVADAAQRRRLEKIAASARLVGAFVEVRSDSVIFRGSRLVQRWLSDSAIRFAGAIAR